MRDDWAVERADNDAWLVEWAARHPEGDLEAMREYTDPVRPGESAAAANSRRLAAIVRLESPRPGMLPGSGEVPGDHESPGG